MSEHDKWLQRIFELGRQKPQENVVANGKVEVMTDTQAYRFRELQTLDRKLARQKAANAPPDQSVYTLAEAAQRLAVSVDDLLRSAASESITCYVAASGLQGQWQIARSDSREYADANQLPTPEHLALTTESCRAIREFGSTNITTLLHPAGNARAQFLLREPQWIDPSRILLKHPLPGPGHLRSPE